MKLKGKLSIDQYHQRMAEVDRSFSSRINEKLNQPTELDPNPTRASAELRASAGSESRHIYSLRQVARYYGLMKGGSWDIEAARKLVGEA